MASAEYHTVQKEICDHRYGKYFLYTLTTGTGSVRLENGCGEGLVPVWTEISHGSFKQDYSLCEKMPEVDPLRYADHIDRMKRHTKFCCRIIQQHGVGKIQGDGRKFLDSFKSYFGSQISSQWLNEVHIYRLRTKSATKGEFLFQQYFCLWLFRVGACCPLTFDLVSQYQRERFLSADVGKAIVFTTQRSQIAFFSVHFPWFLIAVVY